VCARRTGVLQRARDSIVGRVGRSEARGKRAVGAADGRLVSCGARDASWGSWWQRHGRLYNRE